MPFVIIQAYTKGHTATVRSPNTQHRETWHSPAVTVDSPQCIGSTIYHNNTIFILLWIKIFSDLMLAVIRPLRKLHQFSRY